jgi:hypothetical protein
MDQAACSRRWPAGVVALRRRHRDATLPAAASILLSMMIVNMEPTSDQCHGEPSPVRALQVPAFRSPLPATATPSSTLGAAIVSLEPSTQSIHSRHNCSNWSTSSGEIWKPKDTGLQTTDSDKHGFVGRFPTSAIPNNRRATDTAEASPSRRLTREHPPLSWPEDCHRARLRPGREARGSSDAYNSLAIKRSICCQSIHERAVSIEYICEPKDGHRVLCRRRFW